MACRGEKQWPVTSLRQAGDRVGLWEDMGMNLAETPPTTEDMETEEATL